MSRIKKIVSEFEIPTAEMVFFGDSMTDYDAAIEMKVDFIGVKNENTIFPDGTVLIPDFESNELSRLFRDLKEII